MTCPNISVSHYSQSHYFYRCRRCRRQRNWNHHWSCLHNARGAGHYIYTHTKHFAMPFGCVGVCWYAKHIYLRIWHKYNYRFSLYAENEDADNKIDIKWCQLSRKTAKSKYRINVSVWVTVRSGWDFFYFCCCCYVGVHDCATVQRKWSH